MMNIWQIWFNIDNTGLIIYQEIIRWDNYINNIDKMIQNIIKLLIKVEQN